VTTMAISVFKAHALQVVGKVARSRERVVITKRGKPVAQVVPYQSETGSPVPGRLSAALVFEKDIVTPLGEEMWEALR
jgi:prevent-host-death family protein